MGCQIDALYLGNLGLPQITSDQMFRLWGRTTQILDDMFTAMSDLWVYTYVRSCSSVHKPQSISYRLDADIYAKTQTLGSYAIRWAVG